MRAAFVGIGISFVMLGCASGAQETTQAPEQTVMASGTQAATKTTSASDLEDGLRLYGEAQYREAAAAFERAYQNGGSSPALFAAGQSLQQAGDCAAALEVYERLLEEEPDPTYANAVREMIAACQ